MFKKLRIEMAGNEVDQKTLCKVIDRSQTYLTVRMTGRKPFDMDDVYKICDYFNVPYEMIFEYFPKTEVQ